MREEGGTLRGVDSAHPEAAALLDPDAGPEIRLIPKLTLTHPYCTEEESS